jgi:hypothetical protein
LAGIKAPRKLSLAFARRSNTLEGRDWE